MHFSTFTRASVIGLMTFAFSISLTSVVRAACVTNGDTVTCSGAVESGVSDTSGAVKRVSVGSLTEDVNWTEITPFIELRRIVPRSLGDFEEIESHGDGLPGPRGLNTVKREVTLSLDSGHGIAVGGTVLELTIIGGAGGFGQESMRTGGTANGGDGGDGGRGGDINVALRAGNGGQLVSELQVGTGGETVLGVLTGGGDGGGGGDATTTMGFHQANGGAGGNGGDGGDISIIIADGHRIVRTGSNGGVGIVATSSGGDGGNGGMADAGTIATPFQGGAGGRAGDGGSVELAAPSSLVDTTTLVVMTHDDDAVGVGVASAGGSGGYALDSFSKTAEPGGAAGNGGSVTLNINTRVTTEGARAFGIFAQSAGGLAGGGGDGSGVFSSNAAGPGDPGRGGDVSLRLDQSDLRTKGSDSIGILAQSLGGMGGNGGGGDSMFSSHGGDAGSGGVGSRVTAALREVDISTTGDGAFGFVAQSIGGGGGYAGGTTALFSSVGGQGGPGGSSDTVELRVNDSRVRVIGDNADGVLLQSIGGGGGIGATSSSMVSIGGRGGAGGDGGRVTLLANKLFASTEGQNSAGIQLSSIGGGGGNASNASGMFAIGADGGGGGNGGAVWFNEQPQNSAPQDSFATNEVKVQTRGNHSDGVLLQSIGGGGGKGGSSMEINLVAVGLIGSSGGGGGRGGDIRFTGTSASSIETSGNHANGFVAQSIGGGGGTGGSVTTVSAVNAGIDLNVGSRQSTGTNHGGKVSGTLSGVIRTRGDNSAAVLLQSIGGGGGNSGHHTTMTFGVRFGHDLGADTGSGGRGGAVELTSSADLTTVGENADGIIAMSVGGGGGRSGNTFSAAVGASIDLSLRSEHGGGGGGYSGPVSLSSSGEIRTAGAHSSAISALSVAGGGGASGNTVKADVDVLNLSGTVGGDGGAGGIAGDILVQNDGTLNTAGGFGYGIFGQSIGGGGGSAGKVVTGDVTLVKIGDTIGGDGGSGGVGGRVRLYNKTGGQIVTLGDKSAGMLAQSIAGGGGAGGSIFSGTVSMANIDVGIGGAGGSGGVGGDVDAENHGIIATGGEDAPGMLIQSIGGHGGVGGSVSDGVISGGDLTLNVSINIGGSGGTGGNGGDVFGGNFESSSIQTNGLRSHGIEARTLGGSGGDGGSVHAGTLDVSAEGSVDVSVVVGGSGNQGGVGGGVEVVNHGEILTAGDEAFAIFGQSIGGNGGEGGASMVYVAEQVTPQELNTTVTVGGKGGHGARGGDVTVMTKGGTKLATRGRNAHAIYGQSVGGNGGRGGAAFAYFMTYTPKSTMDQDTLAVNLTSEVGGFGGTGMDAGNITTVVEQGASVSTEAKLSFGIVAQSVGGGGGDGGAAGSSTYGFAPKNFIPDKDEDKKKKGGYKIEATIGGYGGAAGDGGAVSVTNDGVIATAGSGSMAIYAQSVGGGGGRAGDGHPFDLGSIPEWKDINELKEHYIEVLENLIPDDTLPGVLRDLGRDIRSIEKISKGFSLKIGGQGGSAGEGGDVAVNSSGTVITKGHDATAIFAQSVGGGGGQGGNGSSGNLNKITMAGSGGGGGSGGNIDIYVTNVMTSGNRASGVFAQSVGGGGGAFGDHAHTTIGRLSDISQGMGLGAWISDTEKGGDGGQVYVNLSSGGLIKTTGNGALGIFAQSVGGGGGVGATYESTDQGLRVNETLVGSGSGTGHSGLVKIVVDGTIDVSGESSTGVFAQSVAGLNDKRSNSGGVTIHVNGEITASGKDGRAILVNVDAQNKFSGQSYVRIAENAVVQTTHAQSHEAIGFLGGGQSAFDMGDGVLASINRLENKGVIYSPVVAVATGSQAGLEVINHGKIIGRLNLSGSGWKRVSNLEGGVIWFGNSELGGDATTDSKFVNAGTIKPGWANDTRTVEITGNIYNSFVQTDTGVLMFDVDARADVLEYGKTVLANFRFVDISGRFQPNFINNPDWASGHTGEFANIVSTPAGVRKGLKSPVGTALAYHDAAWTQTDNGGWTYSAKFEVDYTGQKSGARLGRNAVSFGSHFSDMIVALKQGGLSPELSERVSNLGRHILNASDRQALKTTYGEHLADESAIGVHKALNGALAIQSLLPSCPQLDASNPGTFYRQRQCVWGKAIGGVVHHDTTEAHPGYEEKAGGLAFGTQHLLADSLFILGAAQYEDITIDGDNFEQSGYQVSAGLGLKKEIGNLELSSNVAAGAYSYDHLRLYSNLGGFSNASGNIRGRYLSGQARIAAIWEHSGTYVKPSASIDVTQVWQDGFSETGSGGLNWQVDSIMQTAVYVRPMVEVGQAFDLSGSAAVAFLRTGLSYQLTDPDTSVSASLVGLGPGFNDLNFDVAMDRTLLEFEVGLNASLNESLSMEVSANMALSQNSEAFGGQLKLRWEF